MADSITTNQDLIDYHVLTKYDIVSLTNDDNRYDTWEDEHKQAYSEVLSYLYRTRDIEESDLSDTSQLKKAVCHWVAYLVLRNSKFSDSKQRGQDNYALATKELSQLKLSTGGGKLPASNTYITARVIIG